MVHLLVELIYFEVALIILSEEMAFNRDLMLRPLQSVRAGWKTFTFSICELIVGRTCVFSRKIDEQRCSVKP